MTEQQTNAAFEAANKIEFEDVSRPGSKDTWFLVKRAGRILGMITKFKPCAGEIHPWKAFLGIGEGQKFLGVHYGRNGKDQCVNDIVRCAAGIFVGTELAK